MSKFTKSVKEMVKALGLAWEPIAVTFSESSDERGETRQIRVCTAFDVVRRENVIINFSKTNCVCPGGRHYTGLQILPVEAIAGVWTKQHKAFASMDFGIASIKKQPQPVKRGDYMIISPLARVDTDPDLVIFMTNAEQADRILGLTAFHGAEPFTYYPVSNACSVISNTLAKERPEINFMAGHSRESGNWAPTELFIGVPFKEFQAVVENIHASGFGTAL